MKVATLNERLTVVESDLADPGSQVIARDHLSQTLTHFADLWDALYPRERITLVNALLNRVLHHHKSDSVEICFKISDESGRVGKGLSPATVALTAA